MGCAPMGEKRVVTMLTNISRQSLITDPIVPVDKIRGPLKNKLLENGICLRDASSTVRHASGKYQHATEMSANLFVNIQLTDENKLSVLSAGNHSVAGKFAEGIQATARETGRLPANGSPDLLVLNDVKYEIVDEIAKSTIFFYKSDIAAQLKYEILGAWETLLCDLKQGKLVDINSLIGALPSMGTPKNEKRVGILSDLLPLLSRKESAIGITIGPITLRGEFKYEDCANIIASGIMNVLGK